jgi:hypothetical protein
MDASSAPRGVKLLEQSTWVKPSPGDLILPMGIIDSASPRRCYHASMPEQPRPAANTDEHGFLLSVEEAADRYAAAGHPRTIRAIQKYCGRGDLESQKVETTYGERYLITPASIDRHIAMIEERTAASGHVQSRPAANVRPAKTLATNSDEPAAPVREQPRPDAYVHRLESENEFLRGQIGQKDKTIDALLERDRETNILVGRLQEMLTPLLGRPDGKTEPTLTHRG